MSTLSTEIASGLHWGENTLDSRVRGLLPTWAEFFTNLGWCHLGVPPEFGVIGVAGSRPLLVKIIDATAETELAAVTAAAVRTAAVGGWNGDILIVGAYPLAAVRSWLRGSSHDGGADPPAGLLGEYDGDGWHFDTALWMACDVCGRLGVYNELRSWTPRPCGHDGTGQHNGREVRAVIKRTWRDARAWKARRA